MNLTFRHIASLVLTGLCLTWAAPAEAVRIKDIATFSGVRDNQLIGYGLVVGLAGTGDKKDSVFTISSIKNKEINHESRTELSEVYCHE